MHPPEFIPYMDVGNPVDGNVSYNNSTSTKLRADENFHRHRHFSIVGQFPDRSFPERLHHYSALFRCEWRVVTLNTIYKEMLLPPGGIKMTGKPVT
ncbi:MAG: hypothetical protein D6732_28515 [Methanobacteriota archaeon]|nr:MAG: hypothetical protein D6732_28515 [Euryarchaeota archaeon]